MRYDQILILSFFVIMALQMIGFGLFLKVKNLSLGGVSPINKIKFKTSKISMMLVWAALFFQTFEKIDLSVFKRPAFLTPIALSLFIIGALVQLISYFVLGKSLKFGIPSNEEKYFVHLKIKGLYRFSRNPMYLGFFMLMLSSCLYVLNPFIWLLSIYSMIVHHEIIKKEEDFLKMRFGYNWEQYTRKVRRYL